MPPQSQPDSGTTGFRHWAWACLLVLLCTSVWSAEKTPSPPEPQTLTLGVFAYRPKPIIEERFEPLGHYLSQQLPGHRVVVKAMANAELETAIRDREVDFVLTNPSHYVKLREYNALSGALATMVPRNGKQPVFGIGGVIVRRAERKDIRSLADLHGKTIAIAGKEYLGTYMAPAAELLRHGVNLDSVTFLEASQPVDRVISAVLAGQADAGFARTGIVEDLLGEGKLQDHELEIVNPLVHPGFPFKASTRLYPEWPFLAAAHVNSAITHRVATALLELSPNHPAASAARIYGFTIPSDYAPVEQAMRELRMAPFDVALDPSLHDIWVKYKPWMLALSGTSLAVLMLATGLLANNRRLRAVQDSLVKEQQVLQQTSSRLAHLMHTSPVVIYTVQLRNGRFSPGWVSPNITRLLGYSPEQALQPGWWREHVHPDDRQEAIVRLKQLARLGELEQDYRFADSTGRYHWIHDEMRLVDPVHGGSEVVGAWRDVSQAKTHEEGLRLAASVFENSYDAVVITDAQNHIVDINPAFTRLTGYSETEVLGQNPRMLGVSSSLQDPAIFVTMHEALVQQNHWQGEIWNRRKSGEIYACMMSISAVRNARGELQHYVGVFSDISRIKAHQAELDRLAHYDPLTGVPNRRLLADRLDQAVRRARRNGKSLAVCYLDLDDFKPVNDRLGHARGDQLLMEITRRLLSALRAEDTLARLGGDEFVLLLTEMTQPDEWRTVLNRVLAHVQQPVELGEAQATVSASVGVTVFPNDDVDADTLLRHADQAMYRAKQAGRNRYQLFDLAQDREVQVQREQVARLSQALQQDELVLHYQPQVDLDTGEVVGAEALIRWQHPERGLLSPGAFLWQIEGTDLEVAVGEWVIHTALRQVRRWKEGGLLWRGQAAPSVSVNLSGHQLLRPGFKVWLESAIAQHPGVEPGDLELEILESAAIADMTTAAHVMSECRSLGVRFALDDFGTGYSSLAYFRTLPVNMIKIDQSFVRDMLQDADDHGIVQSVVYLAHAFHRPVIAEGVETLEHAAALLHLGCHLAQGYGIARPMPAERLPEWMDQWQQFRAWETLHQTIKNES